MHSCCEDTAATTYWSAYLHTKQNGMQGTQDLPLLNSFMLLSATAVIGQWATVSQLMATSKNTMEQPCNIDWS